MALTKKVKWRFMTPSMYVQFSGFENNSCCNEQFSRIITSHPYAYGRVAKAGWCVWLWVIHYSYCKCWSNQQYFNQNINTTLNTGVEIGNPWKTFWAVGCTGRGLGCTRDLDSAWTFCTSVENVCADTVSVRMFQTNCFCFKATFSYCQKPFTDRWPVNSWITLSGTSCWKSSVAPEACKLWLVKWPASLASRHMFFTMSLSRCLPLGCLEYQGPSSAVLCKGLQ